MLSFLIDGYNVILQGTYLKSHNNAIIYIEYSNVYLLVKIKNGDIYTVEVKISLPQGYYLQKNLVCTCGQSILNCFTQSDLTDLI